MKFWLYQHLSFQCWVLAFFGLLNYSQSTLKSKWSECCSFLNTSVLYYRLQLVEIMGKRSRKVPVILTPDMIQGIDCLIKYRESANVNSSNKYIFAAPTTANSYLKGWDALTAVCQQIPDLKMPHLIKTTKLRKYVATVSQVR